MEIRIPEVGESVVEALVAAWHKQDGDKVCREEPVCELETDKVTLEINAETDGTLKILIPAGETVKIGTVIGIIREASVTEANHPPLSPAARKLAREKSVDPQQVTGTGKKGRIMVEDLHAHGPGTEPAPTPPRQDTPAPAPPPPPLAATPMAPAQPERAPASENPAPGTQPGTDRTVTRTPLSPIRKRIAERLTEARRQTAMVTTFNEADMGRIIALRRKYQDHFRQKHGISLGLMPFFVKACCEALKEFPQVNASMEEDAIVLHHYLDIGIAVSGEKGLVTPVLRHADRLHFAEIEQAIDDFVVKVREHRLEIADLEGGTFTISNGGVFGSLLSTPLINPPQCATLGMHVIQERPVALLGKVVIRPMMNLALSYDHRIIDGREAVSFLKKVKEYVEEPEELLLEG